jgi:hypothetical protein
MCEGCICGRKGGKGGGGGKIKGKKRKKNGRRRRTEEGEGGLVILWKIRLGRVLSSSKRGSGGAAQKPTRCYRPRHAWRKWIRAGGECW